MLRRVLSVVIAVLVLGAGMTATATAAVSPSELRATIGKARQDNQATSRALAKLPSDDARLVREQLGRMRDGANTASADLSKSQGKPSAALAKRILTLGRQAAALRKGAEADVAALGVLADVRSRVFSDLQQGLKSGFPADTDVRQLRWSTAGAHALADRRAALEQVRRLTTSSYRPTAQAAYKAASAGTMPVPVAGLTPIPGGCALPSVTADAYLPRQDVQGPRLWTTEDQIVAQRDRLAAPSDALRRANASVLRAASSAVADAGSLTSPSAVTKRVLAVGYAWFVTGDSTYSQALAKDMRALTTGKAAADLVDEAKWSLTLATAADWLAEETWAAKDVERARRVLEMRTLGSIGCSLALEETVAFDKLNKSVVIGSATGMVALALSRYAADRDSVAATMKASLVAVDPGFAVLDPDGGSPEGPGYWNFQTVPAAGLLSSIDQTLPSATVAQVPALRATGAFVLGSSAPTGSSEETTRFADTTEAAMRSTLPAWIAGRYGDPEAITVALEGQLRQGIELMWWPESEKAAAVPDDAVFSHTGLAVLRAGSATAWLKGQAALTNHTHLDAGTVTLRVDGADWSFDAGYGIKGPGYSEDGPDGRRWTYAQTNPAWHSTLRTVSGTKDFGQVVDAKAAVSLAGSTARVDLSSVLAGVTSAQREMSLSSSELTITDRIRGRNQPYVWSWVTQASVSVQGQVVTLSQMGRTATLSFDALPKGATISVSSGPKSLGAPAKRIEVALPAALQIDLVAHLRW